MQNFLPLFWNTIQNIFPKFHEMSHDKFIWSYSILCIYSSYRDVNYSRVAISKRTRSNLTKRISVQGYRLRANSHCITFKTGENFSRSNSNESSFYLQNITYIILKKKKKKRISPTKFQNFHFREYPSISPSHLYHRKLFPSFSSKWPDIENPLKYVYISDLARAINKNVSIRVTWRKTRYQSISPLLNNNASIRNAPLHQLHALGNVMKLIASCWHFL